MRFAGLTSAFLLGLALPGGADLSSVASAEEDVGDPQVRTDHPWYPGELACSTFERLFATQAEAWKRVTGAEPRSDEEKALAAWLWRNTHYWHGEDGTEDLWGRGFVQAGNTRDYWTGLFAHGFGLCSTTHLQWSAEMQALLGHGRGRGTGVESHYFPGYSGPPPMVHLRRGERLRRHLEPGLDDGKTFVFWGRNYNTRGIPGPERSRTWVNQPEKMHGSRTGTSHVDGQVRFANAVYSYRPDFASGDYREGVVDEGPDRVVFEFATPYVIAATPPNDKPWGIYEPGCRNGLVLRGKADCAVALSLDQGRTWADCGTFRDGMDLTDPVKGRRQYLLRFGAGAKALAGSDLSMTTVCQGSVAVMPRLKDGGSRVSFHASGRALVSAGPEVEPALTRVVEGRFGTPGVTFEIASPRGEPAAALYASAEVASGNPPDSSVRYQIECSLDGGVSWKPLAKNWTIPRRGSEPADFGARSFCYGFAELGETAASSARVRFRNDGGKNYPRAEVHLAYRTRGRDATKVTFDWTDDLGEHRESRVFGEGAWDVKTGRNVRTRWVEFEPVAEK